MKKIISYTRWVLLGVVIPGALALLALLFFPIAYWLRKPLRAGRNSKLWKRIVIPLWIFLDDDEFERQGHDFGEPWWRAVKGLKTDTPWQKFRAAYLWCAVRNPAWNMYEIIKPKQGEIKIISSKGSLKKNGKYVSLMEFATLKYVDAYGNYMDNKGSFLSLKYSVIGKSKVWYKVGGRRYWRYSFTGKRLGVWWEIQAGTNDRRYTLRFKVKNPEIWEEYKEWE